MELSYIIQITAEECDFLHELLERRMVALASLKLEGFTFMSETDKRLTATILDKLNRARKEHA